MEHPTMYRKLVRDRIPEIIEANGDIPVTLVLNGEDYKAMLYVKLEEELLELVQASQKDKLAEMADIIEVIKALAQAEGYSGKQLREAVAEKREKRGGFEKRIWLESTTRKI